MNVPAAIFFFAGIVSSILAHDAHLNGHSTWFFVLLFHAVVCFTAAVDLVISRGSR